MNKLVQFPEARTHFARRCLERGITSVDGVSLAHQIRWAVRNESDLVEYVMDAEAGCGLYRFKVVEGIFYAVVDGGTGFPRTLYTQEMVRKMKARRKRRKRYASHKARHLKKQAKETRHA